MVTEHETNVPSEVDSSPEVTDSLPIDGDQPLVPADWDSQTEAEVATEEVATTGDETASDEAKPQPEETSDEVTAETEETPEATTESETVEATEGKPSEPRTYSDEEWGKRESSYRQRDTEQQKQVADLQASVAQMQQTYNDQLLDAEVRGYEQSLVKQLTDEVTTSQRHRGLLHSRLMQPRLRTWRSKRLHSCDSNSTSQRLTKRQLLEMLRLNG
jgi:hypothetical protein